MPPLKISATYSIGMKPFDLEAAKRGAPICTRDGRKAYFVGVVTKEIDCYHRVFSWIKGSGDVGRFAENGYALEGALDGGKSDLFMDIATPINGKHLEGPLREAPEHKSIYWLLFAADFESGAIWHGDEEDRERLRDGRVFRTKEARDAMQAEIVKLLRGEG